MKKIIAIIIVLTLIALGGWYSLSQQKVKNESNNTPEVENEEAASNEERQQGQDSNNEVSTDELMGVLEGINEINSIKYDATLEYPDETVSGVFWQKDDKIRAEGKIEGENSAVIIDNKEDVAYMYLLDQGIATEIDFSEADRIQQGSMKNQSKNLMEHNPTVLRSETLDGKDCYVVEYTSDQKTKTLWVWKENGLPLRLKIEDREGKITEISVENIEFNNVNDKMFELPDDVNVVEDVNLDY